MDWWLDVHNTSAMSTDAGWNTNKTQNISDSWLQLKGSKVYGKHVNLKFVAYKVKVLVGNSNFSVSLNRQTCRFTNDFVDLKITNIGRISTYLLPYFSGFEFEFLVKFCVSKFFNETYV